VSGLESSDSPSDYNREEREWASAVAVDRNADIIVVGATTSENVPIKDAFDSTLNSCDGFACKLSSLGDLLWGSFIGGSASDKVYDVAIDHADNILLVGSTSSSDFPTKDAYDSTYNGNDDGFVSKFSPNGSLIWGTFLGGRGSDRAYSVSIDATGNVLLGGGTTANDFPTQNAYDDTLDEWEDAFVCKLASNGSLLWSTFLGGSNDDHVTKIAVDRADNVIYVGQTYSPDFLAQDGYDSTYNGGEDCFVGKFSPNGSFLWSTYLGGSGPEWGGDIAIDSTDNVFLIGSTYSHDFPTRNAFAPTFPGTRAAFLTKFSSYGTLLWSTFLGGSRDEVGAAIAIDHADNIVLGGATESSDFPTKNAYDSSYNGKSDGFVSKISPNGSIIWSTFLGGSSYDSFRDVAIDVNDSIILGGTTDSSDFPTKTPYDGTHRGWNDACACKFSSSGDLLWSTFLGNRHGDDSLEKFAISAVVLLVVLTVPGIIAVRYYRSRKE
jgi:hypothetical protein